MYRVYIRVIFCSVLSVLHGDALHYLQRRVIDSLHYLYRRVAYCTVLTAGWCIALFGRGDVVDCLLQGGVLHRMYHRVMHSNICTVLQGDAQYCLCFRMVYLLPVLQDDVLYFLYWGGVLSSLLSRL
jgi:hypothetical protein